MLQRSEWLHLAERLPVGQSRRYRHSCGTGDALSVQHKPEGYSAWCHRCQAGDFLSKTHVQYKPVQQESTRSTLPQDCIPLLNCTESVKQYTYRFFIRKGIDPNMLPLHDLLWHERTHRVIFKHALGASGRVLQDAVYPKWIEYYCNGKVATHAVFNRDTPEIILTEDILSALKYSYATGCTSISLLGTVLPSDLWFVPSNKVYIALDGDAAGRKGSLCTHRRLKFLGIESTIVHAPEGKDPKDLTLKELRESIHV